jgi:peptide chain release factor subunit 1
VSASTTETTAARRRTPEIALAEADELLAADRLERIMRFHGGALPVVSMYVTIPPATGDAHRAAAAKVDSLLHDLRGHEEGLEHNARISLRGDIERIEAVRDLAARTPGTLAIISCRGAGLLEVVRLPRAVRDRVVVDDTPWVRPMLAVLDEHPRCFAVLVDRESAHAWELYLGRLRDVGPLPEASERRAGLEPVNERRAPHKAEEIERRHMRSVAAALEEVFGSHPDAVLVLGGHEEELAHLLELLPRPVEERLAGSFAADHTSLSAGDVEAQAGAVLERYELEEQRRRVAEALERAAANGHAVVGLERCLWAGSMAAIDDLYVQEAAIAPGVICDRSRWFALSGELCPVCGEPTRATDDVLDELADAVVEEGGKVHHVRAETELRELIVACSLRFELPGDG